MGETAEAISVRIEPCKRGETAAKRIKSDGDRQLPFLAVAGHHVKLYFWQYSTVVVIGLAFEGD